MKHCPIVITVANTACREKNISLICTGFKPFGYRLKYSSWKYYNKLISYFPFITGIEVLSSKK